ncbi:32093_t:CDS:2 [Gigaspora margarita]|uniref:32093_t:CDS:1 n=1 Tax=Gigaspora margarita TaxID=4874 RepID=A0ABN7WJ98_GIGMA|nr:32093_t:CDS:2 [Gigaspora margarita]
MDQNKQTEPGQTDQYKQTEPDRMNQNKQMKERSNVEPTSKNHSSQAFKLKNTHSRSTK